jgi:Rrf2 family protein
MLTRKSKYGLKALLALAERGGQDPVPISELADEQEISRKFLEAILLDLKRHGLLQSKKGKGGGYFLSRRATDVSVGDVIRALEGPLALVPCVSQTAYARCSDCLDEQTCRVRVAMKDVRDATARILDNLSLAALNARAGRHRAKRP